MPSRANGGEDKATAKYREREEEGEGKSLTLKAIALSDSIHAHKGHKEHKGHKGVVVVSEIVLKAAKLQITQKY